MALYGAYGGFAAAVNGEDDSAAAVAVVADGFFGVGETYVLVVEGGVLVQIHSFIL